MNRQKFPFIHLKRQLAVMRPDIEAAMVRVLDHGQFINGPEIQELEMKLSRRIGVSSGVAVGSGTDGLIIALMALGVKPGDRILVPAFTFAATVEAVVLLGAEPVFVDVDRDHGQLDPDQARAAWKPGTTGAIGVGLYGRLGRWTDLLPWIDSQGMWFLEDAAQSYGSRKGRLTSGGIGAVSVTSFYPSKPLGAYGDAGMIFTRKADLAEKCRQLRNHGEDGGRYNHVQLGINARMDSLQAAILLVKHRFFEKELENRAKAAAMYTRLLEHLEPEIRLPRMTDDGECCWSQYTIQSKHRARIVKSFDQHGIPYAIHYPSGLHRLPPFERYAVGQRFPETDRLAAEVISLPMSGYIYESEIEQVVQALCKVFD